MSPAAPTLDAIDRAFLRRAERTRSRTAADPRDAAMFTSPTVAVKGRPATQPPASAVVAAPGPAGVAAAASTRAESRLETVSASAPGADAGGSDPGALLVAGLLRAMPAAWEWIARRVEEACRDGARVIAVAGSQRGEGRTTVVRCLARTLQSRGWRVSCHTVAPIDLDPGDGEKSVALVDAGVWFPSGPLRRPWLERQSLGCHAAILIRRADQPECPAREAALEAIGVKVLGEVVTRSAADAAATS